MKKDTVEKWILLEQSGELDFARQWLLHRHLRQDAHAASFKNDAERITLESRNAPGRTEVSRATMASIAAAARESVSRSEEFSLQPSPIAPTWRPAMAFAAALLLVGAGWLVLRKPVDENLVASTPPAAPQEAAALAWDDGLDETLDALDGVLASVSEDWDSTSRASDMDELAEELMTWEGTEI